MVQDRWSEAAKEFYSEEAESKRDPGCLRVFAQAYRQLVPILQLSPEQSLLDIGCGCGELARAVHGKAGFYCGLDISLVCLQIARNREPESGFLCGDMTCLPLQGQFDCITAMTSLEFCCDKPAALREIARMLNNSGQLYIEVRNADFLIFRLLGPAMKWLEKLGIVIPCRAEGFRDLEFDEWLQLLEDDGFDVTDIRRSLRPAGYGGVVSRLKNYLIKLVAWTTPVRHHYMIGLLCGKSRK